MGGYTVSELAKLSGVSIRTLHHYDEVGLLKPAAVGANGYRYYGREQLLRLQQILFHRELGFPLAEIKAVLDAPGFDRAAALRAHRKRLETEQRRYRRLIRTIDDTLAALEGDKAMDEKAIYKGFDPKKQAEYEAWFVERYGAGVQWSIDASKAAKRDWKQADFDRHQAEWRELLDDYASALGVGDPPDSERVFGVARRHQDWVAHGWGRPVSALAFRNLAKLYSEHPDFSAGFETRAKGLTEYMQAAMRAFADRELS